jgi:hypothetical protein
MVGVHVASIKLWETGRTEVEGRYYPALISFSGCKLLPVPEMRGEAVARERSAQNRVG